MLLLLFSSIYHDRPDKGNNNNNMMGRLILSFLHESPISNSISYPIFIRSMFIFCTLLTFTYKLRASSRNKKKLYIGS